jgi:hypothetical protein
MKGYVNYLTKKLMRDMEKGGVIIAPRRSGKSVAIVRFLRKHKNFAVSCPTMEMAQYMKVLAVEMFGVHGFEIKERCLGSNPSYFRGRDWKVIIDEAFWHPMYLTKSLPFHCALSSFPKDLILYNEKGKRLSLKADYALETSKEARDYNKNWACASRKGQKG